MRMLGRALLWICFFPVMLAVWAFRSNSKVLGWIVVAFFGLALIGAMIGGSDSEDPATTDQSSAAPAATPQAERAAEPARTPAPAPIQNRIGDTVSAGNFSYSVQGVKFTKSVGNEYTRQVADGIYLLVDLAIRNDSRESHTLDGSMFKVVDAEGRQFDHSVDAATALQMSGSEPLFLKQCQPGIVTSGLIPFEVPSADGRYTLRVTGGFWSGKTADIVLSR